MITSQDTKIAWANTVATVAGTAAKGQETTGLIVNAAAWVAANTAMAPAAALIAVIVGGILLLVGALAVVTIGINKFSNALNSHNIAAEQAIAYADTMTEKYETLADEANNFKEAVSGYEDAVNSLKTLDKETDEYKQTLEEANKEAEKLIEMYDRSLIALLIGNNIVNTLASSIGTVVAIILVANRGTATTIATIVMTILVFLFGEVFPKNIAKSKPETYIQIFCYPMIVLYYLFCSIYSISCIS